jgi:hypothetical protein
MIEYDTVFHNLTKSLPDTTSMSRTVVNYGHTVSFNEHLMLRFSIAIFIIGGQADLDYAIRPTLGDIDLGAHLLSSNSMHQFHNGR